MPYVAFVLERRAAAQRQLLWISTLRAAKAQDDLYVNELRHRAGLTDSPTILLENARG